MIHVTYITADCKIKKNPDMLQKNMPHVCPVSSILQNLATTKVIVCVCSSMISQEVSHLYGKEISENTVKQLGAVWKVLQQQVSKQPAGLLYYPVSLCLLYQLKHFKKYEAQTFPAPYEKLHRSLRCSF